MIHRRQFLAGLAAAAVIGFDPVERSWLSVAHAKKPGAGFGIPELDGELVSDAESLAAASSDSGNIIFHVPLAVLRPGSTEDIAKMIGFCRKHGIKVAARGQGHTTFGQALVSGGLVIDMSTLNAVHWIGADRVEVEAGLRWSDLLPLTLAVGLTPPVLTGFIGLSIGGTLSVGGVSPGNRRGAQVDHVLELEVVTGKGEIVRCSEHQHRLLFESVLAGLGQCAIITRAVIELLPAPAMVRTYQLPYFDNATFFGDLRTLLARNELDDIANLWFPDGAGGWVYVLNAARFFDLAAPPDDSQLLRDLHFAAPGLVVQDVPYLDYSLRVDVVIDFFKQIGLWHGVLHPWFDVFLPDQAVEQYVAEVLPTLGPEDVGPTGFMLLFPLKRSSLQRRLLRVPNDDWIYLFDILTAAPAPGPNPAFATQMLARNRALFEKARAVGGTRYPIGSLEFSVLDWAEHYGSRYLPFHAAKNHFDPDNILTPGPAIFG